MALPLCECIKGLPQADKLDAIYCALLAISEGGGEILLSQITDLDPSWIPILQAPAGDFEILAAQISNMTAFWRTAVVATPAANTYLTSNGAQALAAVPFANITITAAQISDATDVGRNVLAIPTPGSESFIIISAAAVVATQVSSSVDALLAASVSAIADGTTSPVNSLSYVNGRISGIS